MILYAVCVGVALIVSLGMFRIAYGFPLLYILIPGYAVVTVIMFFSDKGFLSIAVDEGGVPPS